MSTTKKKKWNMEEAIEHELTTTGLDRKFEKVNATDQGTTYLRDFDQPVTPKPIGRASVREDIPWNEPVDFVGKVISAKPQSKFTGQVTKEGIRAINHPREEIDSNFDRVTDEQLVREAEQRELNAGFEDRQLARRQSGIREQTIPDGMIIAQVIHPKEDADPAAQRYRPLDSLSVVTPNSDSVTQVIKRRKN